MLGKDQCHALTIREEGPVLVFIAALVVLQVVECGDREGDLAEYNRLVLYMIHICFLQDWWIARHLSPALTRPGMDNDKPTQRGLP